MIRSISLITALTCLLLFIATPSIAGAENFKMEQSSDNSGGTLRRMIDLVDPWSGAYLYENITVKGKAEINDSFTMYNMYPGLDESINEKFDSIFSSDSANTVNIVTDNEPPAGINNQLQGSQTFEHPDTGKGTKVAGAYPDQSSRLIYSWWDLF